MKSDWSRLKSKYGKMFVPPEQIGLPPVSLMIVGESPAHNEVEQGKPFVGFSGQFVRNKLSLYKFLKRGWSVYITNAVKIANFDSDNRNVNPTDREIDEWRNIVIKEIVAYNPAAVLMLGHSAIYSVTGLHPVISLCDNRFSSDRTFKYEGIESTPALFLTFHPSALRRNESYEEKWCDAWEAVAKFLRDSK